MTEQQEKTVEIYVRPQDSPANVIKDEDLRVFYNGNWVDFRKGKIERLKEFRKTSVYRGLDRNERERLIAQELVMEKYSVILGARINAFSRKSTQ